MKLNWLLLLCGVISGRQRRKFILLSVSHFMRVSTLTISVSGPGLHVNGIGCVQQKKQFSKRFALIGLHF